MHDFPEWLEEDGEASSTGEAFARSSHEPLHPKPPPNVASGKHSIHLVTGVAKCVKAPKRRGLFIQRNVPATNNLEREKLVT